MNKISSLLQYKSCCIVEDFMLLPANTEVCILIPVPPEEKEESSFLKSIICNRKCYVTFGSNEN